MESGEIKSILKPEQSPMSSDLEVKSILKSGVTEYSTSQSTTTTTAGHGILKEVTQQSYYSQDVAETRGILKKEKSLEAKTDILPERGVLKKETSFEARTEPEKGVLKKESTFERMQQTSSRSILKDSSFESGKEVEPAGILKSPTKTRGQVYGVINGATTSCRYYASSRYTDNHHGKCFGCDGNYSFQAGIWCYFNERKRQSRRKDNRTRQVGIYLTLLCLFHNFWGLKKITTKKNLGKAAADPR